ncbi:MAG TPA: DUF2474 domain-containing protein [Thermohalobaculum sp.]|nr:DUF2474 domain-containing protein [Thermohalobaculum sp.]
MPRRRRREGLARRLGWFAGLWVAGVGTVAAVAYALRWWLVP